MQQQVDQERAREFAGQLMGLYTGGILSFIVDLGYKTGLMEAAAREQPPELCHPSRLA